MSASICNLSEVSVVACSVVIKGDIDKSEISLVTELVWHTFDLSKDVKAVLLEVSASASSDIGRKSCALLTSHFSGISEIMSFICCAGLASILRDGDGVFFIDRDVSLSNVDDAIISKVGDAEGSKILSNVGVLLEIAVASSNASDDPLSKVGDAALPKVGDAALTKVGDTVLSKVGDAALPKVGDTVLSKVGDAALPKVGDTVLSKVGDAALSNVGDTALAKVGDAALAKVGDAALPKVGDAVLSKVGDAALSKVGDAEGSKILSNVGVL